MGDKAQSVTLLWIPMTHLLVKPESVAVSYGCGLLEHNHLLKLLTSLVAYCKPCMTVRVKGKHRKPWLHWSLQL